jgi:hypothetical protein
MSNLFTYTGLSKAKMNLQLEEGDYKIRCYLCHRSEKAGAADIKNHESIACRELKMFNHKVNGEVEFHICDQCATVIGQIAQVFLQKKEHPEYKPSCN